MLTPQWFAHRGSPDGRAYVSKDALAAATAEFFPEHKDLAKDILNVVTGKEPGKDLPPSTRRLIDRYKAARAPDA